jgi:polyketide synthase PksN
MAEAFRGLWNGASAPAEVTQLLAPALVFHFHAQQLHGARAYQRFMAAAQVHTGALDLAVELVLARDDLVLLVYRWRAARWHRDITGGGEYSNYCKVVLRVQDGRIAEIWQQAPDFLFLLGKLPPQAPMQYPQVALSNVLACDSAGIHATDDGDTHAMRTLFQRMNDCFLNRSSLRHMQDIQNQDIVYDTGGTQGVGVQAWKTFVYALHTCLGEQQGTRFDDFYVRDGDRLRVFLRATVERESPYLLRCADGLLAAMQLRVRDGRIAAIETRLENYIQFLDTDFTRHQQRLKQLFQGRREPVVQAAAHALPGLPADAAPNAGVAIVGMAGRFPQCDSVAEFWDALAAGRSLISPLPPDRPWLAAGTTIGHAGFIDCVDHFDAGYFQMLPDEARFIDPQQRLLLQEIVHSIEDSGHTAASYAGPRTGLFIATLCADYQKLLHEQGWINDPHTWAGNEPAMFAARVARCFDIQGPCRLVNAECTSSLVALHEAARLIRAGEIDQAIVGATNLLLHPYGFAARTGTLLTQQPQARLFSRDSDGQLRGEAVVSVVLKSLGRAQADGDRIYGLLAGSAVNNSGRTLSLAAGHVERQAAVMQAAWRAAGVAAGDVSLIECHASGVRGGDFAEVAAIQRAFGDSAGAPRALNTADAADAAPVQLTTAKAATGHAEAASGLASLVKVLLQLQHDVVAGTPGLDRVDPDLRLDARRFALSAAAAPWPRAAGRARVAGINGFAAGGYNAHVVVQEYMAAGVGQLEGRVPVAADRIVLVSAQSQASLHARLRALQGYLAAHPQTSLAQLALSLRQRDALRWRAAFVPADVADLQVMLAAAQQGRPAMHSFVGRRDKPSAPSLAMADDGDPLAVAAAWAGGQTVDWPSINGKGSARLNDMPAYPFDTQPCWLPPRRADGGTPDAGLQPLALQNVSTLSQQRYLLALDGGEPWLADHVVRGQVVLPGVACLEVACAAAALALNCAVSSVQLHHVAWVRPLVFDGTGTRQLQVELTPLPPTPGHAPRLAFAIASLAGEGAEAQPTVHCQGQVQSGATGTVAQGALDDLKAACTLRGPEPQQLYAAYFAAGLAYGPRYRAVTQLFTNGAGQVLARLELPPAASADLMLHPSMMDAAIHAAAALTLDNDGASPALALPFAVEQVRPLRATTAAMWAWIRDASDSEMGARGAQGARVRKLDIDVFDDAGRLCVALAGFSLRSVDRAARTEPAAAPVAVTSAASSSPAPAPHMPVLDLLRAEVARLLQVPVADISPDEELSAYGFDSINLTSLGNRLNEQYQLPAERPLNPTIFFEYPSLGAFARYLASRYPEQVTARHGAQPATAPIAAVATTDTDTAAAAVPAPAAGDTGKGIAIVGVSASFPQAPDLDTFWHNLATGRDCIGEVPAERWDWRALSGDPAREPHKTDVKWGGFMDGIGEFDPLFFGISPREAELMDPQHRLLLQHAWHAIEEAGYNPRSLSGSRTGVFMATANSGYSGLLAQAGLPVDGSTITGMVPSVAPNRISYLLNLHGPSEPVETACSSALVAIHRAMAAIDAGHCDMALVGAVNTIVTPDGHIGFRKAGMLCEDGRCKTFSRHANGYVRGEGVGVLLLKRLTDAERGGDHVHAVLRGSAENHGGRANSLTAPNPNAQAQLIAAALTQAGIDPRTVGYIEAHGTGTALGDPIEINGLKQAFAELYARHAMPPAAQPHCGLGSVKSNIGHLELAAGMAGVIKVLLQMRHRTLAPTLHAGELNPYLELAGSPFYVVHDSQPWPAPIDDLGRELPRRAGVSSFGFGGANAHVVLEEYRAAAAVHSWQGPFIIALSARNERQLLAGARRLHAALGGLCDDDLPALACTLQLGREAMVQRVALVVASLVELRTKLDAVLGGDAAGMADVYLGAGKAQRDTVALFQSDDEWRQVAADWLARGKYRQVLPLWVCGLELDWTPLYAHGQPRRLSLPGYPFARDRYWVPQGHAGAGAAAAPSGVAPLHPLLHVAAVEGQRYRTTFTGNEFFLRDHVVMQRRVLPAVAYLEMVRVALMQAAGPHQGVMLRDVAWLQPLALEPGLADITLDLTLTARAGGELAFDIGSSGTPRRSHCQGVATLVAGPARVRAPATLAAVDPTDGGSVYHAAQIYAAFAAMGIEYGPAHRPLRELRVMGQGTAAQVRAVLELPAAASDGMADYVLHPAMLDGALQAAIGFMLDRADGNPLLPFHLRRLEVLAPCTASMQAVVRQHVTAADEVQDDAAIRLDIDLYDAAGMLCVRLAGLASRQLAGGNRTLSSQPHALVLAPVWEQLPQQASVEVRPRAGDRVWLLADADTAGALQALWPDATPGAPQSGVDHVVWAAADRAPCAPASDAVLAAQEAGVFAVFGAVKALMAHGYGSKPLAWTLVTTSAAALHEGECSDPSHAGVRGLAGVLAREYPGWTVRTLDLARGWSNDLAALRTAFALPPIDAVVRAGACHQRKLAPLHVLDRVAAPRLRESSYRAGGVYVVIGGAGGIGALWTEHVMRNHQAQVVWIGRRPRDAAIAARIEQLTPLGPPPLYLAADATDRAALAAAREAVLARFGRIDGLVHAAAVLADASLERMDETHLRAVYASKVDTSVRMAQVFAADRLDFVLYFSSLVTFAQPPGQANYVAGCAFQDAHAQALAAHWSCPVKVMNWGYWGGVGMAADDGYRDRMARLGVGSINAAEGMEALEMLLADTLNQSALVNVTRPLAELSQGIYAGVLAGVPAPSSSSATAPAPALDDAARLTGIVTGLLSVALKVSVDDIDPDEPFTAYGVDSITGVQLAQTLNQRLGLELDVTLFFDHGTVRRLTHHLLERHGAALATPAAAPIPAALDHATDVLIHEMQSNDDLDGVPAAPTMPAVAAATALDGIAIVGLSAAFPQADGAEALWEAVTTGRNCVTEVPKQRWDWEQVGDDTLTDAERACFRWGAFIDGVDLFDAGFFGIAPEEATYMSPQQRLLLTHAWRAIEDAGIAPATLAQVPTGVFIASVPTEYLNRQERAGNVPLVVTGLSTSMIPNRISQCLNLRGPSEHCDTACSSTLVALHRAVQAMRNGECEQALVGAVNLLLTPAGYIGFQSMGYLSAGRRMAAFEPGASGFVRAESVGALLLKPLRQAVLDGDHVYGVIRGTGVAHGGGALSLTMPNGAGMRQAIRQAYQNSGVDPGTVAYIEAHGIASPLGDAIEINALRGEYGRLAAGGEPQSCHIGTARPSVGYAEVASGLVAVVKVLMAMRHRTLPGIPGFAGAHANLASGDQRFVFSAAHQPWPAPVDANGVPQPRRAAINNFGFSGVNAHLVLEEAPSHGSPPDQPDRPDRPGQPQLIVLSARTDAALRQAAAGLLAVLRAHPTPAHAPASLSDIAYTLQTGRAALNRRMAIVVDSHAALAASLARHVESPGADDGAAGAGAVITGRVVPKGADADPTQAARWAREHDLVALARHWVRGGAVDWHLLRPAGGARRVALPGHPLSPRRYWVAGATGLSALHGQRKATASITSTKRARRRDIAAAG